jgi:hypothetical protein
MLHAVLAVAVVAVGCSGPDAETLPVREWEASLSGANEVPAVTSAVTATASFNLTTNNDSATYTITIGPAFPAGDTISQAHIHSPAAANATAAIAVWLCGSTVGGGSNPPVGPAGTPTCPTGLTANTTITGKVAISSTVLNSMRAFTSYVNVHTKNNGGGEIRGQLRNVVE